MPDGLEKTLAVNHLAPFVLTHLLLDLLRAAPAGRILTAASEFHSDAELDFSNLQGQRQYNWLGAYKRSKLCNILFTYELSRRLAGSTITANCFSPGPTLTRLGDNMRGLPAAVPWLLKHIPSLLAFPEGAARTPVYVASSPDLDGVSGRFFWQCREMHTKPITYDSRRPGSQAPRRHDVRRCMRVAPALGSQAQEVEKEMLNGRRSPDWPAS